MEDPRIRFDDQYERSYLIWRVVKYVNLIFIFLLSPPPTV